MYSPFLIEMNENMEVVSVSCASHNGTTLRNLVNLIYSRGPLISRATGGSIGARGSLIEAMRDDAWAYSKTNFLTRLADYEKEHGESLYGVKLEENAIIFNGFLAGDEEYRNACLQLVTLINEQALHQKRVQAKQLSTGNEKNVMRSWLTRMGMSGLKYKETRKILLQKFDEQGSDNAKQSKKCAENRYCYGEKTPGTAKEKKKDNSFIRLTLESNLHPDRKNGSVDGSTDHAGMLRVAAYIRVSTEKDTQEDSYEVQREYFEELLSRNPGWISAGVYLDYGISGTSKEKRTGFNRLMRHCREGKINRIITKSISRFSRNARDFLKALDILKANNITIVFEKEHIDTAIAQNDIMLTAFGAVAQEESRSISANIRWGMEKRRQRGETHNICIYGYRYADMEDGYEITESGYKFRKIVICEEEAAVVRRIFEEVVDGRKYTEIARGLNRDKIPLPQTSMTRKRAQMEETPLGWLNAGLSEGWTGRHISQIIRLERYAGDVRMVKSYTEDYKSHRSITNKGEREQYYVKNHHPAIIRRELFEQAQIIREINKSKLQNRNSGYIRYPFSGRLVCKHCGRFYRIRSRASGAVWSCPSASSPGGERVCTAEKIYETQLIYMCRKAVVQRYRLVSSPVDAEVEELLLSGVYNGPIEFTVRSRGLVKYLLHALERVQLADSMEHDRSFLHGQIAKCEDAADRARQTMETLQANIEAAELRRDILHEELKEEVLTAMREKLMETGQLLQESERQAADLQKHLQSMEKYWADLEADYEWRKKAISWMKTLPEGQEGMQQFLSGLTDEYVKAFILYIEVESPLKYRVRWFDDTWTGVELYSNVEENC